MYSDIILSATVKPQRWRKMHLPRDLRPPNSASSAICTR